jgi:hypothetical protein
MTVVSHQTIKLSKGKHSSPEEGACVMELASMLAGESFTDHPNSACPVIGSLLRAYNDYAGDERRQDLYVYAARVVGSRGGRELQRARAERVADWSSEMLARRLGRFLPRPVVRAICHLRRPELDSVGTHAIHSISRHTDETHAAVLALVDELLAMSGGTQASTAASAPEPPARVAEPVA